LTVFEVVIDEKNGQKVAFFGQFGLSLNVLLSLLNDSRAEGAKSFSVALLVPLKRRDVVLGKHGEELDVRHCHPVD